MRATLDARGEPNCPAGHGIVAAQTDPGTCIKPALQTHAVTAVLPAGESELAGQSTQPEFPVPDLYVPPEHCAHVPPLGPFHPALHWQAVDAVLPSREVEKEGHP